MYKFIDNNSELNLEELKGGLATAVVVSIDTEATSLDTRTADWILLQIKFGSSIYLFDARKLGRETMTQIINLINKSGKKLIAHNAKYDLKIIYHRTGILLKNIHDTMLVESFIYKGLPRSKVFCSLGDLVELYTGESLDKEVRSSFIDFKGDLSAEQLSYAALDVLYLEKIYDNQILLVAENGLNQIYSLEMELIPVVTDMEITGVYVDQDEWKGLVDLAISEQKNSYITIMDIILDTIDYSKYENGFIMATAFRIPVRTKRDTLALESLLDASVLREWLRNNLNINSTFQLRSVLNKEFGMDLTSTNEKILKDIKDSKIIPHILKYREYEKKITTYGEAWLRHINPLTGRVHSEFLQNGTDSGRFSSTNPNLQNIPAEAAYRHPFKATEGKLFVAADYSQMEYRLAGAITKDPAIIRAYVNGKDMHTATASIIFKKDMNVITKEERNFGKTLNFAVLYGTTAYGLSYNLKIEQKKAEHFLDTFFKGYPALTAFKNGVESTIFKLKKSSTVLGRKRYWEDKILFADYKEAERYESRMKREGFNHIIQGTGADICKLAMIKIFKENPFGNSLKLIIQIHDEVVAEVDKDIAEDARIFITKCMIDVFQPFLGEIPAQVDAHVNACWTK